MSTFARALPLIFSYRYIGVFMGFTKKKRWWKPTGFQMALIVLILMVSAFFAGAMFAVQKKTDGRAITIYNSCEKNPSFAYGDMQSSIRLPAVNRNGTGVAARLDVYVTQGSGLVLVNLNKILPKEETLSSIRTAALVASELTNIDTSNIDITYDLYANATVLEGPSAGAAIALATIAALEGKDINEDVMITGAINHDGTIGPAGKIKEKAISAKETGAKAFYVPIGAGKEINYTEEEFCHKWGTYEYCQPELRTYIIDLSDEAGIDVIEAENVKDLLSVFLVDKKRDI